MSPVLPPGVRYTADLLAPAEADAALDALVREITWEEHSFRIFGRTVPMPRKIQMYGPHGYAYSGVVHPPRPLPPTLDALRQRVEAATGLAFNSALCNLYRTGHDSMGWHRDDDYAHGGQPAVASLSLGAPRTFRMRPVAGGPSVGIRLAHGSLLVIDGEGRTAWSHALPRTAAPVGVRVNLTFRHMVALVAASPR